MLVRRLKRDLRAELPPRPDGSPRFQERQILAMEVDYPTDERRAHAQLDRYAELRRDHHTSGDKRSAADFVTLLLKKRLLSSPVAFANTLAVTVTAVNAVEPVDGGVIAFAAPTAGASAALSAATATIAGGQASYGSIVLEGRRAERDSAVVARLRAAGAVIVGSTRSHEFGWGITTQNPARGSATSARGNVTALAWQTTLAPILISFSRSVVTVHVRTGRGSVAGVGVVLVAPSGAAGDDSAATGSPFVARFCSGSPGKVPGVGITKLDLPPGRRGEGGTARNPGGGAATAGTRGGSVVSGASRCCSGTASTSSRSGGGASEAVAGAGIPVASGRRRCRGCSRSAGVGIVSLRPSRRGGTGVGDVTMPVTIPAA